MASKSLSVDLVLGGGGAKGFAHVGVLQALTERNVSIHHIVGTSIGALIGAHFSYHLSKNQEDVYNLDNQKQIIDLVHIFCRTIDICKLLHIRPDGLNFRSFLSTERLESFLLTQFLSPFTTDVRSIYFDEMDFDLTITATNVTNGDEVVFDRHRTPNMQLHHAVMASISIPLAFRPYTVEVNGEMIPCWDGGLCGNCRVDLACKREQCVNIIASSLTRNFRDDTDIPLSGYGLVAGANRLIDIMLCVMDKKNIESLDEIRRSRALLIEPNTSNLDTFDFGISIADRENAFRNGKEAAEQQLNCWRVVS